MQVEGNAGVEQPLGQANRDRRRRRQLRNQRGGLPVEVGAVDGAVDQAPPLRLRPAELAPEDEQLPRPGQTHHPWQQPGRAAVGGEAARHEGLPEARVARRDREVGGQCQLEADARRPPAHHAHHRYLHLEHQRDEPVRLRREPALDAAHTGALPSALVASDDVEAAAEVVTAARQRDDPHTVVLSGALQLSDQRGHRRVVERVAAGAVERQPEDGAVTFDVEAHANPAATASSAPCRSSAPPGGRGRRTGPCRRLGSSTVAWPGHVTSPRWFSPHTSRSTAGPTPSAR